MKPIKVLLVEDNPADADLAVETLEMSKLRIEMQIARDGQEALDILGQVGKNQSSFDLILLDLNLPRVSGHEVLEHITQSPLLKPIPVVVLTSSDADMDIHQCYALGANCYVKKPVDLRAFQEIVESIEHFWFTVVKLPPQTESGSVTR